MKQWWRRLGNIAFWACWPALYVYMHLGERTRVVVVAGGQVLVVKGWLGSGKWVLPGGGVHKGEDPLTGALRELYEETGLRLQPEDLTDAGFGKVTDNGLTYRYQAYIAHIPNPSLLEQSGLEIIERAWVPMQSITALNAQKSTVELVKRNLN